MYLCRSSGAASAGSLTTPRNNRVNTASARPTPSTSRRSVRQNHVTRRRKSPAAADNANAASNNSASVGNSNNNNNCTSKNNNNAGKLNINNNETSKVFHEKSGLVLSAEKGEGKSVTKINCVTKKEAVSLTPATSICNSVVDAKAGVGVALATNATITTRGNSVKQTHLLNDSAIATPPQDVSHTHTIPASEEVINTRRKTRSVANSNGNKLLALISFVHVCEV